MLFLGIFTGSNIWCMQLEHKRGQNANKITITLYSPVMNQMCVFFIYPTKCRGSYCFRSHLYMMDGLNKAHLTKTEYCFSVLFSSFHSSTRYHNFQSEQEGDKRIVLFLLIRIKVHAYQVKTTFKLVHHSNQKCNFTAGGPNHFLAPLSADLYSSHFMWSYFFCCKRKKFFVPLHSLQCNENTNSTGYM